jgi:hypothetical protein
MTTATPVDLNGSFERDDNTILIVQKGQVIGVLSEEGQEGARTLRLTLTRETPDSIFQPLQGTCVEAFR